MANYRREIKKNDLKLLHSIYKNHVDADGGIFTKDKRRKLLGLKKESGKYFDDTADFWYDVRSTIKSGLKDLELFFDVAHPDQIKEIIYDSPLKEEIQLPKNRVDTEYYILQRKIPSITKTLTSLFQNYYRPQKVKIPSGKTQKYTEHVEEKELWRAFLVYEIIKICITYLKGHNLISSKAHERVTDEFQDLINVEIARGQKLSLNERVHRFV